MMNPAMRAMFERLEAEFRSVLPSFDSGALIGMNMDAFHKKPAHQRQMLENEAESHTMRLNIGSVSLELHVAPVLDAGGRRVGAVLEWTDRTEEQRKSAILEALDASQIRVEFDAAGRVIDVNTLFVELTGIDRAAAVQAGLKALVSYDEAAGKPEIWSEIAAGRAIFDRFAVSDEGERHVVEGGISAIRDHTGAAHRFVLMAKDVTESRREAEAAEAERARLQAAQARVVKALQNGLNRLAEGDLTVAIDETFEADYERLRGDFNSAVVRLREAMTAVVDNAELIRGEAGEITGAAEDLSGRTETQAATLEETAAALDELTASVKSAAEGAARAAAVVDSARSGAQTSGEVVREAVSAMGEIARSSEQISKIIGVIDDIAFQTNLLALNAGVEAARAGDAGRGFAVVASEVRALAQRSSEAAREINGLISSSGAQVKRGVDLVGEAGRALEAIVASVGDISEHVAEIATSSSEQSRGLAEINSAVNQLDQVTQQNVAMFEETTAASHALNREAEALGETVARFRIGERRAPAAPKPAQVARPVASAPRPKALAAPAAARSRPAPAPAPVPVPVRGNTALAVEADAEGWTEF